MSVYERIKAFFCFSYRCSSHNGDHGLCARMRHFLSCVTCSMDARVEADVEAMVDSHFEIINALLAEIQGVKAELAQTNKKMSELEGKLALYQETGSSNISRMMFRRYVLASIDRQETDEEWRKFIETFENDNTTTTNNIYKWIDKNISR